MISALSFAHTQASCYSEWALTYGDDASYAKNSASNLGFYVTAMTAVTQSDVCRHSNAFLALKQIVIYFQLAMSLTLGTYRCWNGVHLCNYGPLSLCITSTTFPNTCSITLSPWMWVCLKRWLIYFKAILRFNMTGDADEAPRLFLLSVLFNDVNC